MTYLDLASVERVDNQVIDLMDIDLGNLEEMERAVKTLNESRVRTIMLSSGAGITKYNREMKSPAISGRRLLTMDRAHMDRALAVVKEQDSRGLNFTLEIVGVSSMDDDWVQSMVRDNQWYVTEEYYPVYNGIRARWRITRAKMITNNPWIWKEINESIAGRKIVRTVENRTIKEAVTKGTIMTRCLSIIDRNNQNAFNHDQEGAEQFWDDISGKRLDNKLVKKAREEEMREVFKHNVYEKVDIQDV